MGKRRERLLGNVALKKIALVTDVMDTINALSMIVYDHTGVFFKLDTLEK